jgi:hypothetical protein
MAVSLRAFESRVCRNMGGGMEREVVGPFDRWKGVS